VSEADQLANSSGDAVAPTGAVHVIRLPAEIDIANAGYVKDLLLAEVLPGRDVVIADLSGTFFCDCAGVSALIDAGRGATRAGVELRVVAQYRSVLRTFELAGLGACLPVYPTVSVASANGRADPASGELAGTDVFQINDHRRTVRD
jgi:anti-anti-sigma factor